MTARRKHWNFNDIEIHAEMSDDYELSQATKTMSTLWLKGLMK